MGLFHTSELPDKADRCSCCGHPFNATVCSVCGQEFVCGTVSVPCPREGCADTIMEPEFIYESDVLWRLHELPQEAPRRA